MIPRAIRAETSESLTHFVLQPAAFHELRLHFVGARLLLQRVSAHFPP
jgi:hypothetical protein